MELKRKIHSIFVNLLLFHNSIGIFRIFFQFSSKIKNPNRCVFPPPPTPRMQSIKTCNCFICRRWTISGLCVVTALLVCLFLSYSLCTTSDSGDVPSHHIHIHIIIIIFYFYHRLVCVQHTSLQYFPLSFSSLDSVPFDQYM